MNSPSRIKEMFSTLKSFFGLEPRRRDYPPSIPLRSDAHLATPLASPPAQLDARRPAGFGGGKSKIGKKKKTHRRREDAATIIKDAWRTYMSRKRAVILIQARYRGHVERIKYLSFVASALKIQAHTRGLRARRMFAKALQRNNRRKAIAYELLETERSYLRTLVTLRDVFLVPLRAIVMGSSDGVGVEWRDVNLKHFPSAKQVESIFSNLEMLVGIHTILLDQLEGKLSTWHPYLCLGRSFLGGGSGLVDSLKFYTLYVNNYDDAVSTLRECMTNFPSFDEFIHSQEKDKRCHFQDVESLLINPVQRLPRYVMLFSDLRKHTLPHHPDYIDLTTALEKIRDVASFVNERKREAEAFARVCDVQRRLVGKKGKKMNLIRPNRNYCREGSLIQIHPKKEMEKEMYVFLFSDVFVPSKKSMKKKKALFSPRETVRFGMDANEVELKGANVMEESTISFKIVEAQGRTSHWRASSQEECQAWMHDIQRCISDLK